MRAAAFLRSYGLLYATAVLFGMLSTLGVTVQRPVSPLFEFVISWGIAICVAMWVVQDARSRRCTPCFDFGTFIFFTWFLSVPCYLIATRGWRGLLILVTTFFTMILTMIGVVLLYVLASLVA